MTAKAYSGRAQHLMATARQLFLEQGIHATGIDQILKRSGTAKMTLYNNFGSKEALVIAVLEAEEVRTLAWLDEVLSKAKDPKAALLGLFDAFEAWFSHTQFRGSLLARAAAEFPARGDPVHRKVADYYAAVLARLENAVAETGRKDARSVAGSMLVALEGATGIAHATGASIAARRAKRAAAKLLG